MNPFPLYFLTAPILFQKESLQSVVEKVLGAGIRFIQYRVKEHTVKEAYHEAIALRKLTRQHQALLIINDSIDLALAVGADGVHLGQEDLPLEIARRILGREKIIGISTHSVEEAKTAEAGGADYIGLGPIYESKTKVSTRKPLGLFELRKVRNATSLPIYAIGGITQGRLLEVMESGADGVAVIAGLMGNTEKKVVEWLADLYRLKVNK